MSDNLAKNFTKLNSAIPLETWELTEMYEYLIGILDANPKQPLTVAKARLAQIKSELEHRRNQAN